MSLNLTDGSDVPDTKHASLLEPQEHVLSTLERDGSRRWICPSLAKGRLWHRRRVFGYALIAFFVTLPHLRIGGEPAVLLDIIARRFTIFGHTFFPTDTPLLALGVVGVFLSIVFLTSLMGRVWCGWACPQTVYMEFLFRPIDRLFDGTAGRGGVSKKKKSDLLRVLRFIVYALLSMVLAHTFLAFFVGTDKLAQWIRSTPIEHPFAFLIMFGTTVAMMFDFLYFREQTCLIACPYGRFQSVMLDRNSLIVGYDYGRGEPRGKMRKHASLPVVDADKTQGDCVDCHRCVAVCPTGIDIRNGLQMECINCTQCIDACNDVMRKIGRPEGLIRYTSQNGLERRPTAILRPRTILYPLILLGVATAFFAVLSTKFSFDARLLRTGGNPFSRGASGELRNSLRVRLVNRTHRNQTYSISAPTPTGISVTVIDPNLLTLQPGESSIVPIMVELPTRLVSQTKHSDATLEITDLEGNHKTLHYILLGLRN